LATFRLFSSQILTIFLGNKKDDFADGDKEAKVVFEKWQSTLLVSKN
jgi:hypothetical protein